MARHFIFRLGRELAFPPADAARPDGLLAAYGDLSVPRLVLAYESGIFPWYSAGSPILWWSPPTRAVVRPAEVHVGRSLRKSLRRGGFAVRLDTAFQRVIHHCARTPRPDQDGTWIVPEMEAAYVRLHHAGLAHSVEAYLDDVLVGGLYGVSLGGCFFGESMFSHADDASKVAFAVLARLLAAWGFDLIDCQLMNQHVERFGAYLIPRAEFLARIQRSLQQKSRTGSWAADSPGTDLWPTESADKPPAD